LLNNKKYSKSLFKKWVKDNTEEISLEDVYEAYFNAKIDKEKRVELKVSDLRKLLNLLKKEVNKLKHGKKKKET
jgi:hypothetical protein